MSGHRFRGSPASKAPAAGGSAQHRPSKSGAVSSVAVRPAPRAGLLSGIWVWHMGLIKNFEFGEKAPRLRWELTATNIFNHPNWSNPATNISTVGQVGVISGVGGVQGASTGDNAWQREFRMGVRLEW